MWCEGQLLPHLLPEGQVWNEVKGASGNLGTRNQPFHSYWSCGWCDQWSRKYGFTKGFFGLLSSVQQILMGPSSLFQLLMRNPKEILMQFSVMIKTTTISTPDSVISSYTYKKKKNIICCYRTHLAGWWIRGWQRLYEPFLWRNGQRHMFFLFFVFSFPVLCVFLLFFLLCFQLSFDNGTGTCLLAPPTPGVLVLW